MYYSRYVHIGEDITQTAIAIVKNVGPRILNCIQTGKSLKVKETPLEAASAAVADVPEPLGAAVRKQWPFAIGSFDFQFSIKEHARRVGGGESIRATCRFFCPITLLTPNDNGYTIF